MGKPGTSATVSASGARGQPAASPRGAPVCSPTALALLTGARLPASLPNGSFGFGREELPLHFVMFLRCLAGAWQALDFLAGTGDGAVLVPKVTLRVLGLKSISV